MQKPLEQTALDFSACEREPIHIIGSVQSHGALLVLGEPELKVLQASANAKSILHFEQASVVGQRADSLFSDSSVEQMREILSLHKEDDFWPAAPCAISLRKPGESLQGLLHRYKAMCILELEKQVSPSLEELTVLRNELSLLLAQFFRCKSLPSLLEYTASAVQKICDFDRVLIYQFDSAWHGTVVAEKGRDFMSSYINHRFPASDIPPQARDLYTKNLLRLLVDVDAVPSPIMPAINPLTGSPPDLSYSALRSMSPVHIEYLKNMGVNSSMSISLMVRGKLWGLIVCHHTSAKTVDFATRSKCQLVAEIVSNLIEKIEENEETKQRLSLRLKQDQIVSKLSTVDNLSESLCRQVADLLGITNATGVALIGADVLELSGITPDKETVQKLYSWLSHMEQESLFSSDRLSLDYPQWNEIAPCASGLLAINISGQKPLWILWFRPELIKEVLWAGNPHKPVEIKSNHADLHPRKSFELWKETVRRYCRPWLALEMEAADSMKREIFVLTLAEILRSEKTRKIIQQQREDVLSILAHDMNAPVAAMERILGDLLSDTGGRVPAQLRETLQVLETGNRQQLTRIRKLLRVLAYEVGTAAIDNTQIDCAEIIRQSIAEVVPLSDHGGAQIITTIKQDNGNFKSDPESIRRLVVNLVDNALRAAGSSGTVNVLCETIGTKLRIQIADNGPGIAVEDQEHLFERFWHGSVAKPYAPHVGMGLYLCKRIVDSLNGNISCESELGKGASFTVIVPTL